MLRPGANRGEAAIARATTIAAAFALLMVACPIAAQEARSLHIGDAIMVSDACLAEGHEQMTSPSVTASRQATMDALARLREEQLCYRFAQAQVVVIEIAEPVLIDRLGQQLYGFRFRHLERDLWAAHYETPAP